MIALSVNLNKIALLRNSREGNYPNVLDYARLCLEAGADGITVHPRPDQRHIRPTDVYELADMLEVEFNIEGNPFEGFKAAPREGLTDYPGFMALVRHVRPAQATLVPDANAQLTSDHGFDLRLDGERLKPIIDELKSQGIRVSLFMDPDLEQISLAHALGADRIELYTGPYAHAVAVDEGVEESFARYASAAAHAVSLGLGLNAGHDLNLVNLPRFAGIPGLQEVSIGHALTADALIYGMGEAVRRYKQALGG